ncbi:MAG: transposase [Nitrosomonas sp.]|nr:transposase [Nitrosomonas sp.]
MEGTNNKIKALLKMAYGFRDVEFFKTQNYSAARELIMSLSG